MKRSLVIGTVAIAAAFSSFALAQTSAPQQETATAQAHALMAATARSLATTHMHLHHVVNCLEGPQGRDFDAKAGNPCASMGHGALNDAGSDAALHKTLEQALTYARAGLKDSDPAAAKQAAQKAADELKAARGGK